MVKENKYTIKNIIKELLEKFPIEKNLSPSHFVKFYWGKYNENFPSNNSVNGGVFEQLLVIALLREGIEPVYTQAKLAFVPNVILDIVLYNRKTPITISAKTTLRERWKQADLEAMATKYVHREAKCFVLTLSKKEVGSRRREENSYMGIDDFVLADTEEFDVLVSMLKKIKISESESIKIIETDDRMHNKITVLQDYGVAL